MAPRMACGRDQTRGYKLWGDGLGLARSGAPVVIRALLTGQPLSLVLDWALGHEFKSEQRAVAPLQPSDLSLVGVW